MDPHMNDQPASSSSSSSSVIPPAASDDPRTFLSMTETHDDHGYKVIALRLNAVKAASKFLILYFRKKIKYEEDYSSRLLAMANELKYESDTAHVNTTEQQTIDTMRNELREVSAVHMNVANRIRIEILKELTNMRDGHKKTIRECFECYDKDTRAKNNSKSQHQRTEKHYVKCCSDLSALREGSFNKTGKEAEKHAQRTSEADQAAKAAEIKYKAMDEALKMCIIECDANWARTLVTLERVERQRLDETRSKLMLYTSIAREGLTREEAIYSRLGDIAGQMSTGEDLANFVRLTADVKAVGGAGGAGAAAAGTSGFQFPAASSSGRSSAQARDVTARLGNVDISSVQYHQQQQQQQGSNSSFASSNSQYGSATAAEFSAIQGTAAAQRLMNDAHSTNSETGSASASAAAASASGVTEVDYFDMSIDFPAVCQVVALYEYKAALDEELSFEAGQRMTVIDKQESGWWIAECHVPYRRRGLIPSNFVKVAP